MKNRKTAVLIASITSFAIAALLHSRGYKIYGHLHMYRCPPPSNEGWQRVVAMEKNHFILDGGKKIQLHPFYLTEKALALSPEVLAKQLFDLSYDDVYVRTGKNEWMVRAGNRYVCSHPSFFPEREYGYYESALLDSVSGAETNVPLGDRLVWFESEEALQAFYDERRIKYTEDDLDKAGVEIRRQ